jgi:hypothetical protein
MGKVAEVICGSCILPLTPSRVEICFFLMPASVGNLVQQGLMP